MTDHGSAIDRHGRRWTARVVPASDAGEDDFDFWFDSMSPEQRVEAVGDCLLSALKTRGVHDLPRLRRVHRVVERQAG